MICFKQRPSWLFQHQILIQGQGSTLFLIRQIWNHIISETNAGQTSLCFASYKSTSTGGSLETPHMNIRKLEKTLIMVRNQIARYHNNTTDSGVFRKNEKLINITDLKCNGKYFTVFYQLYLIKAEIVQDSKGSGGHKYT